MDQHSRSLTTVLRTEHNNYSELTDHVGNLFIDKEKPVSDQKHKLLNDSL